MIAREEHQRSDTAYSSIDYDQVKLPEWFHEPGIHRDYVPWQHTPLLPYAEVVRDHQTEIFSEFEKLASEPVPRDLLPGIVGLVHMDFMTAIARRQTECAANFSSWISDHPDELEKIEADSVKNWILGEGLDGHGSARSQLELLIAAPSLRSLDLQVLTTPYGYRRQYLPAMRAEMDQTLESVGAARLDEAPYPPKAVIHPLIEGDDELPRNMFSERGLLVTQKRLIGVLAMKAAAPLKVIERQVWMVRADSATDFDQEMLDNHPTGALDDARTLEYVADRIAERREVIPLSTMTYAYRQVAEPEVAPPSPRATNLRRLHESGAIDLPFTSDED